MLKTLPLKSKFYSPLNYKLAAHFIGLATYYFSGKHLYVNELSLGD